MPPTKKCLVFSSLSENEKMEVAGIPNAWHSSIHSWRAACGSEGGLPTAPHKTHLVELAKVLGDDPGPTPHSASALCWLPPEPSQPHGVVVMTTAQ